MSTFSDKLQNDPETRALYEKYLAEYTKEIQPLLDEIEASERITGEDLAIIVR